MYEQKEVFKHSLRDYQKPVFQDMLSAGGKVILKAPMDYGKTYLACVYVSHLFQTKGIRNVAFSIPNYQMRRKVIDDLKTVGMKDAVIVCPEGRERAFKSHKKRVSSLRISKDDLKGQTIDLDYVQKRWPKHNPYYILIYLQRYADVIIVHHSLLKANKKLRKTDLLIIDDADLMNRDRVFSVAQYDVYQRHLQSKKDTMTEVKEIRSKLKWYIEKNKTKDTPPLGALEVILDKLFSYFPGNPDELERKNVVEIELQKELNHNPVIDRLRDMEMEGKTEDERLQFLINQKLSEVRIGISQASNPVKWNSVLSALKDELKSMAEGLSQLIEAELAYAFSAHIDYRMEEFFNAVLDPEFQVKLSQIDRDWSSLEIYLKNGAKFMDVVNQYSRILWISATADPEAPEFKGFRVVKSDVDPNAEHKHVTIISKEMIPDLLFKLKNHNVFVITNSGNGAKEFIEKYGCGEIFNRDSLDGILKNAKNGEGIIAVGYVNGIGSRGLDNLAELFDAVIVESWIYRSVIQEDGKFYGENHMQNNLSDAVQILSRIMRGEKNHVLFVVKDGSKDESGTKIFDFLKDQNPAWNYADGNYADLISRIPERTQIEKSKIILKKTVQRLKDGTFSLSYTGRIAGDDLDRYPDLLEL